MERGCSEEIRNNAQRQNRKEKTVIKVLFVMKVNDDEDDGVRQWKKIFL